jgi:cell division protein FtsW (lipid II flippase)
MKKMTVAMKQPAARTQAFQAGLMPVPVRLDVWVLIPALLLLSFGIVMVGSASIAIAEGQGASTYHYLFRHLIFIAAGVSLALMLKVIPMAFLERVSRGKQIGRAHV